MRVHRESRFADQPSGGRRTGASSTGQALVEFSLVIPLFLVLLMALVEFGLGLNALLSINFASRDGALVAAKAGNVAGSDCLILREIERDIGSPADSGNIQSIEIFWSDQTGKTKHGATNVYTRGGSTSCLYAGQTIVVPYTPSTLAYAEVTRCNVLAGCGGSHIPSVDTIGVRIHYEYPWHTPLQPLLALIGDGSGGSGTGWSLVQTNAMRMEPVL